MEFRKDINGLRALAVIGVMLYHFGLFGFTGGYAGVDVFFVISGFLMTGIIVSKLEGGNFSLKSFYLARARRILPALLVLCAALLCAGYFWLGPTDYKTLGGHAASAVTFISNFIFKGEDGYFDAPARDKWMLHTWSLSVEWQFYLIYPLLLMGLHKKGGRIAVVLAGLLAATLALSVLKTPVKPAFSFFLLPTRIWEFMAGGLVWLAAGRVKDWQPPLKRAAEAAGLALVLAAYFVFDSDTAWPGWAAALPVAGTCLVILAAREDSAFTCGRFMQRVGSGSYSLYLWHWPVFVGLAYFGVAMPLGGIFLSLVLGALSYRYVETPFRRRAVAGKSFSLAAGAVALAGIAVFFGGGMPWRVSPEIAAIDRAALDKFEPQGCGFRNGRIERCFVGTGEKIGFAIWGDSHATAIANAAAEAGKTKGVLYPFGCPTIFDARLRGKKKIRCAPFNEAVLADLRSLPPEVPVIVMNRFTYYLAGFNEGIRRTTGIDYDDTADEQMKGREALVFQAKLADSLCRIARERETYVVRPIPEMGGEVPKTLVRRLMAGRDRGDVFITQDEYRARHMVVMAAMNDAASRCGVQILDPLPFLCRDGKCYGSMKKEPLYFDDDHLNSKGNHVVAPMFQRVFR